MMSDDQVIGVITSAMSIRSAPAAQLVGGPAVISPAADAAPSPLLAAAHEGVSIVIPTRNEERLDWTVSNLLRTWGDGPPCEVVIVDDGGDQPAALKSSTEADMAAAGWPLTVLRLPGSVGNCYARHLGLVQAAYHWCLVLDAHCDFPAGFGADLWRYARDAAPGVAGLVCVHLTDDGQYDTYDAGTARARYYGARVIERIVTRDDERRILQARWLHGDARLAARDTALRGEVQPAACALGGAYAIHRPTYLDRLAGVWQYLRGWGTSEPTLCLWAHLLGIPVTLWPVEAGHVFRGGHAPPYRTMTAAIRYNQAFLARLLLGDGDRWRTLVDHMQLAACDTSVIRAMLDAVPWTDLDAHREAHAATDYDGLIVAGVVVGEDRP
jgi:hypothetical protein